MFKVHARINFSCLYELGMKDWNISIRLVDEMVTKKLTNNSIVIKKAKSVFELCSIPFFNSTFHTLSKYIQAIPMAH